MLIGDVLVVGANKGTSRVIEYNLDQYGAQVKKVHNIQKALDAITEQSPNVIVLDTRELGADIPVLVQQLYSEDVSILLLVQDPQEAEAVQDKIKAYVTIPFNPRMLCIFVYQLLIKQCGINYLFTDQKLYGGEIYHA